MAMCIMIVITKQTNKDVALVHDVYQRFFNVATNFIENRRMEGLPLIGFLHSVCWVGDQSVQESLTFPVGDPSLSA